MVGRLLSYWGGLFFRGELLDFGRVYHLESRWLATSMGVALSWAPHFARHRVSQGVAWRAIAIYTFTTKCLYMGVDPKIGVVNPPKWMVYFMENPMNKWDDLGGKNPYFLVQHPYSTITKITPIVFPYQTHHLGLISNHLGLRYRVFI